MNAASVIFGAILDTSWRVSCLILAFLALRPLFRRHVSARVYFWVWLALALRLLVPFAAPVRWSPFNLLHLKDATPQNIDSSDFGIRTLGPATTYKPADAPAQMLAPAPKHLAPLSWQQAFALIWAAASSFLIALRIRAHLRFAARLRSWRVQSSGRPLAGGGIINIYFTDAVGAPALHGIFKPKLLFPATLAEQISAAEFDLIIAHEASHQRRHDLLAHAVIQAAQIVHWFNPLIWFAARAARQDCELACDESVVRNLDKVGQSAYGATLLKVLSLSTPTPSAALGLGILESHQQIKRRIQMIIADPPSSTLRTVAGVALLSLIALVSVTRETRAQPAPPAATAVTTSAPHGWSKNGTDRANAYVAGVDRTQTHDGSPSAYVKSIKDSDGFGGMMQMCLPGSYIGKRIRYSAWMKTADVSDGGAHLWFRVDGPKPGPGAALQFDNMSNRAVVGTTDWQHYSVVLDVPPNATALAFGFFVERTGQAWVSEVKLEEVGLDVPSTNIKVERTVRVPHYPPAPVNLGFD